MHDSPATRPRSSFSERPVHPSASCADLTDEQLMKRIQHKDENALTLLHQRHHARFRSVIGRMISDEHDLDDIEQQCLLQVWRNAGNYHAGRGQAQGWLMTLARRRTVDFIRRKNAYNRARDRFRQSTMPTGTPTCRGADEAAAGADTAGLIGRMIGNLPETQQQAVELAYFRGMTQRQIAAHTGLPLGTVKTRLELALRKLRLSLRSLGELRENSEATCPGCI